MYLRTLILVMALSLPWPLMALDTVALRLDGATQDSALEAELRAASVLLSSEATAPGDILAQAQGDYTRIVEALYANGHYSPVVTIRLDGREAAGIDPFAPPKVIRSALIVVDPGPRFTFGTARIAPRAPGSERTDAFSRNAPARADVVRDAVAAAISDWRQAGHAKAQLADQSVIARHDAAKLDVTVGLDPGPRLRFGQVVVTSDSGVRDARIRQIAGIPRGESFDPDTVEKAATRLRRTGTFRSVTLTETDRINAAGEMDIDIAVTDQKIRRIGGGAELSSLDGLTLSAYWLHRNLFGGAERLRIETEIAQITGTAEETDFRLSFGFEKPAVYGPDTDFTGALEFAYLDEPDFVERRAGLSLGVSREYSDDLTGEMGIGLAYSEITDQFLDGGNRHREMILMTLPTALTFDRRDSALDATSGFYLRAGATPFFETVRSDPGARFTLDARAYRALGEAERMVLAGRLQLGSLVGPEARHAPPGYLFYSGGGGTVRGQPYNALDADYGDMRLGGRSFAGVSGELRFGVTDTIGIVAFADAGAVATGSFGDGDSSWHGGGGLGLRYKTPVGPIRFDIAAPLTDNTADGVQFYIGIGQAF